LHRAKSLVWNTNNVEELIMKKSMLAISACLALGITACSDRETAPAPTGDMANGRAEIPAASEPNAPMGASSPASDSGSVVDSNAGTSDSRAGMGTANETRRSTTYRSKSVVKNKRARIRGSHDDNYAANRRTHDGYTESDDRMTDRNEVNAGSTSASSDGGYTTQSEAPMNGQHNPAAINSGY
jgi:hypothetical protein